MLRTCSDGAFTTWHFTTNSRFSDINCNQERNITTYMHVRFESSNFIILLREMRGFDLAKGLVRWLMTAMTSGTRPWGLKSFIGRASSLDL
jgi:hypothetical protein